MKWNEFFKNNITGYLLSDLEQMNKIKVDGAGNCGYPMLMTMLSGMELLGGLTYPSEAWHKSEDKKYFNHYLDKYLSKVRTEAKYENYKEDFWNLLRHKLAHTFLTVMHFRIAKNVYANPINHHDKYIDIDVGEMFKDFKASVLDLEKQLESDNLLSLNFEKHLADLIKVYSVKILPSSTLMSLSSNIDGETATLSGIIMSNSQFSALATTAMPIKGGLKEISTKKTPPNTHKDI